MKTGSAAPEARGRTWMPPGKSGAFSRRARPGRPPPLPAPTGRSGHQRTGEPMAATSGAQEEGRSDLSGGAS